MLEDFLFEGILTILPAEWVVLNLKIGTEQAVPLASAILNINFIDLS